MIDFSLTDEQMALRELAHDFASNEMRPVAWDYDRDGTWPQAIIEKAWEVGLMNAHIPEEYGGAGASSVDGVLIEEELGWGCSGIGTSISCNGLATAPLLLGGSEQLKKTYLGMSPHASGGNVAALGCSPDLMVVATGGTHDRGRHDAPRTLVDGTPTRPFAIVTETPMSASTIHVEPTATGRWIVRHDNERESLSEHDNATDAQRIACDLAHRRRGIGRPPARPLRARPPRADRLSGLTKTVITRETLLPRRVTRSPMPERSPSTCRHGMPLVPGRSAQGCGRRRGLVARPICTVDLMAVAMPGGHAGSHGETTGRARHCRRAVGSPCAAIGACTKPRVRRPSGGPRGRPSRCS